MKNRNILVALTAIGALWTGEAALAQSTNATDETQMLISQIQTDKRAIVLRAMQLTDAEVAAFAPVYDQYQAEMKGLLQRGGDLLTKYASNYDSMTDDAAKDILKDVLKLRDDRNAVIKKYAKKLGRVLSPKDVLRWVQIENKTLALLDVQAAAAIPLTVK
jgi:hypothetical protein